MLHNQRVHHQKMYVRAARMEQFGSSCTQKAGRCREMLGDPLSCQAKLLPPGAEFEVPGGHKLQPVASLRFSGSVPWVKVT